MIRKNTISVGSNLILNSIFILFSFACVFPLLLTISISLSNEKDIILNGFSLIPKNMNINAYRLLFIKGFDVGNAYLLTALVTIAGTAASVTIIALFAYPLSRTSLRYRGFFMKYIAVTMLFNGGLVPWYVVCTQFLHLKNSFFALTVPYLVNVWHIIIMRTFYKTTIPASLIESAKVDGAGELRIFLQIVSPLSKASYATIALFTTLIYWNDWWLSMMLSDDSRFFSLQYYIYRVLNEVTMIQQLARQGGLDPAMMEYVKTLPAETSRFAMCVLAIGPILFAYPFFQKYFVRGLTIGAVKG